MVSGWRLKDGKLVRGVVKDITCVWVTVAGTVEQLHNYILRKRSHYKCFRFLKIIIGYDSSNMALTCFEASKTSMLPYPVLMLCYVLTTTHARSLPWQLFTRKPRQDRTCSHPVTS